MSRLPEREAVFADALRGRWGRPLEFHETLASTQDRIFQLADEGAPAGACVIAGHQLVGRGQRGRHWIAAPGQGLLFSLLLRPEPPAKKMGGLPALMASLALLKSLAPLELNLSLRWPNDLMAGPRKIAGILMEGRIEGLRYRHLALGLGLNLEQARVDFPPELAETAVSLHQLLGQSPLAEDLLAGFLVEMETLWARLEAGETASLMDEWRSVWAGRGHRVQLSDGIHLAENVDDAGVLLLSSLLGERRLLDSADILAWEMP